MFWRTDPRLTIFSPETNKQLGGIQADQQFGDSQADLVRGPGRAAGPPSKNRMLSGWSEFCLEQRLREVPGLRRERAVGAGGDQGYLQRDSSRISANPEDSPKMCKITIARTTMKPFEM